MLFVYLCHMTLFVGCLSLHGRRVYAGRHCLTCLPVQPPDPTRQRPACYRLLCEGQIPQTARNDESVLESLPRKLLPNIILHKWLRYLILLSFASLLAVSIYGYTKLRQGIYLPDLVQDDSYWKILTKKLVKYFQDSSPVTFVVDGEVDYSGLAGTQLLDLLKKAREDPQINNELEHCWLSHYLRTSFYTGNKANFVTGLQAFLKNNSIYKPDIRFTDSVDKGPGILASRCSVVSVPIVAQYDFANLMVRMRDVADDSPMSVPVFAYFWTFITSEGMLSTLPNTISTLAIAVGAIVIVCLIFLPHPFMVSLITLNILMILCNIFGFMYFWDITLSVVTMIHLIMSVGFSVDFSAHVCSAYLMSNSLKRTERAYDAITHAASPIFNGGMSSFVGVFMLLFSNSYIFVTFFKIMLLVIGFGMLNAILLMPAILSLIGPENSPSQITIFSTNQGQAVTDTTEQPDQAQAVTKSTKQPDQDQAVTESTEQPDQAQAVTESAEQPMSAGEASQQVSVGDVEQQDRTEEAKQQESIDQGRETAV